MNTRKQQPFCESLEPRRLLAAINGTANADIIRIISHGTSSTITVNGTAFADVLNFNAFSAAEVQVTRNGTVTTVTYSNLSGSLTVGATAGSFDVLNVLGTEGPDSITATATTITRDGTVTVGAGIDRVDVYGLGGNDTINLAPFAPATLTPVQIFGGQGNDTISGTDRDTVPDLLSGDEGNDVLMGLRGDDTSLGGDGNDIFGNPSLVPNGAPDDRGLRMLLSQALPDAGDALRTAAQRLAFKDLTATFDIGGRRVTLKALEVDGKDVQLKVSGNVGFDGSFRLQTSVQLPGTAGKRLAQYLPNGIPLGLSGTFGGKTSVKPDIDPLALALQILAGGLRKQ